ncbi:MAG: hypothetical protein GTO02_15880 [Candidatus Dadabacteria bacterium]|nr:hypothetical protein [Candidatus Dadabacteria bacterium]
MKKLLISFLLVLVSNNVLSEEAIKLSSVGFRWTHDLEGITYRERARMYLTTKVYKNHIIKFAWEMQGLRDPVDIFNDSTRNDSAFIDYEYKFE